MVNADFGYRRLKTERRSFSSVSISLGYLMQSQIISVVYNLSDGSIKEKNREQRGFFVPTINYEFGRVINSTLSWYSKYSLGAKFSADIERPMVLFVEAGIKLNL